MPPVILSNNITGFRESKYSLKPRSNKGHLPVNQSISNISASPGDPYWSNVVFLHNFNESITNDIKGLATISTTSSLTSISKFGLKSLVTNTGTIFRADFIQAPISGNFTIEAWIYLDASGNTYNKIWNSRSGDTRDGFDHQRDGWASYSGIELFPSNAVFLSNQWLFWTITREGNTLKQYVDGINTATYIGLTNDFTNTYFYLGGFNGKIDEIRITKDIVRYTSNFTPPTTPFPTS